MVAARPCEGLPPFSLEILARHCHVVKTTQCIRSVIDASKIFFHVKEKDIVMVVRSRAAKEITLTSSETIGQYEA